MNFELGYLKCDSKEFADMDQMVYGKFGLSLFGVPADKSLENGKFMLKISVRDTNRLQYNFDKPIHENIRKQNMVIKLINHHFGERFSCELA